MLWHMSPPDNAFINPTAGQTLNLCEPGNWLAEQVHAQPPKIIRKQFSYRNLQILQLKIPILACPTHFFFHQDLFICTHHTTLDVTVCNSHKQICIFLHADIGFHLRVIRIVNLRIVSSLYRLLVIYHSAICESVVLGFWDSKLYTQCSNASNCGHRWSDDGADRSLNGIAIRSDLMQRVQ